MCYYLNVHFQGQRVNIILPFMPEPSRCPFSFGSSYQNAVFLVVPMRATGHTYFTLFYLTVLEFQINFSAYHFKLAVICPHFSAHRLPFTLHLPIHLSGTACCMLCATFTAKFCRSRMKPEVIATPRVSMNHS